MGAPRIADHDPAWADEAESLLERIRAATTDLPGSDAFALDHIGSTSVPGLAAKPIIDLQLLAAELPSAAPLTAAIAPLGLVRAQGSRPDSPGVHADIPRLQTDPDPALHAKLLFHRPEGPAGPEVILHVRRADSPFAAFVLAFRDWLRSDPDHRARYEAVKRDLADRFADAADYDDYTRAKSAFIAEAQRDMGWPG
ncbi:GrpB family protein [Microbacterium paludicola]|uniref:GrpB family protein n=1 Tax=Microbacterium paludicola TaxID=300019 RepID=A0A4Y9FS75_9MICO|nr:GrpB family protein [Microbacterium paludicola]MBF0817207.1 GrpB family protein [Microbacterium paludicola]TFU32071.1 GrpB family protein [Microbacterium paludicola]